MNKHWYSFGNPFKVKFRKHYCYKCGSELVVKKHHKIVHQKTEEAKYYDFDAGGDEGVMVGPCEFIHKIFFCPKCCNNIEFITQLSLEDVDIILKQTENYFRKKDRFINISKRFQAEDGKIINEIYNFSDSISLSLIIKENSKEDIIYNVPIKRKNSWERPYYFDILKNKLIDHIQNS